MEKCSASKAGCHAVILELGVQSDQLFIILRGSCTVRVQYADSDGSHYWQSFLSFYEGQHFSESALVQSDEPLMVDKSEVLFRRFREHPVFQRHDTRTRKGRIVTSQIVATEDLYYLQMQNNQFQQILIQSVEKDIQPKITYALKHALHTTAYSRRSSCSAISCPSCSSPSPPRSSPRSCSSVTTSSRSTTACVHL